MISDCHNDLLLHVLHQRERGHHDPFGDFWLSQLRAGGVVCQVLPICIQQQFAGEAALRRCLLMVEEAYRFVDLHPADVAVVGTADELDRALGSARIALVLALEGAEPVGADLEVLRLLFRAGVRMASLTWNRRTLLADGVGEQGTGGRLTGLGVEAVTEMERIGMVLDVSHLSEPGFWHVEEIARKPYLASHSSCRALHGHPRNLSDEQIRAIAARGGLVGMNAFAPFLGDRPSVGDYVDHVAHAVDLVGADRVMLGPDFFHDISLDTDPVSNSALLGPGRSPSVPGLRRPADLAALAPLLADRLGEDAAARVCSHNLTDFLLQSLPKEQP